MLQFKYCGTHIKDEEYMNYMSSKGHQVKSLIEYYGQGFFFCYSSIEYTDRIFYFRDMSKENINKKN